VTEVEEFEVRILPIREVGHAICEDVAGIKTGFIRLTDTDKTLIALRNLMSQ
jgi:hypothetical protein